ncbi:putative enzymatic polyprotein [Carpediemonas membranifera]|uniref:Putative enzymatic polyprotein n=1 Tax=Carpediemonas membranifera TaxID=201153 RepID=A0A8J6API7_9EUKA|nr:putative enzymatic polyprotein [Carpediemonas membranifera]|eukprot:KAG9389986.1 putative enzymatic polyprotein [Carpediemonas membranifera]
MTVPSNPSELRSFCGLANYYRDHVADFARIMAPLYDLCGSKTVFEWGESEQTAWDTVKRAIVQAPLLSFPDYSKPLVIKTDASSLGCGALLAQQDPVSGKEAPVAFVSRRFTMTESAWATIEQEAYGIFFAITKFDPFIRGQFFEVQTDHKNLIYMSRSETPKVVRWSLRLQEYVFVIHHIPGLDNAAADVLSRCLKAVTSLSDHHVDIESVHGPVAGHMGAVTTMERLKLRGIEWTNMLDDIKGFIASCPICQKVRETAKKTTSTLRPTFSSDPFVAVSIDTMGPFPEDDFGNKFIIVTVDNFSRFTELVAVPSTSSESACRAFIQFAGHYGFPQTVRTDGGSQFTAKLFKEILASLHVAHTVTLPYHHRANGLVERVNREVNRHLVALTSELRLSSKWSLYLPMVQRLLNATTNSSIGMSPAALVFGTAVNLDRSIIDVVSQGEGEHPDIVQIQEILVQAARLNQDQTFNPGPSTSDVFAIGDQVLVTYPTRPDSKLTPQAHGPLHHNFPLERHLRGYQSCDSSHPDLSRHTPPPLRLQWPPH